MPSSPLMCRLFTSLTNYRDSFFLTRLIYKKSKCFKIWKKLQKTHQTWKKSTPNKQFTYNNGNRRRSSVWATLGSMTKSFTENSIDQLLSQSTPNFEANLHQSRDNINLAVSNKFCEFIVDTYVLKSRDVEQVGCFFDTLASIWTTVWATLNVRFWTRNY